MVRAVMRLVTILLLLLFALAIGVEAACTADEDHGCECDSCAFCNLSAIVSGSALPVTVVSRSVACDLPPSFPPSTPDLGRLTPPPRD